MKVNYVCETCGKTYRSEEDAKNCEQKHVEYEKRRQMEITQERDLFNAINSATNLYVQRYGKLPNITLTEENEKILVSEALHMLFND